MVDILYILKDKLLPIKGVPRKAEFIQQNRTEWRRRRLDLLGFLIRMHIVSKNRYDTMYFCDDKLGYIQF